MIFHSVFFSLISKSHLLINQSLFQTENVFCEKKELTQIRFVIWIAMVECTPFCSKSPSLAGDKDEVRMTGIV